MALELKYKRHVTLFIITIYVFYFLIIMKFHKVTDYLIKSLDGTRSENTDSNTVWYFPQCNVIMLKGKLLSINQFRTVSITFGCVFQLSAICVRICRLFKLFNAALDINDMVYRTDLFPKKILMYECFLNSLESSCWYTHSEDLFVWLRN